MDSKKHTSFFIFIGIIFCILYIFLAIKPLGREYQFNPKWKIDVTNPTISENTEEKKLLYFKLGQTLGYFTEDGKTVNFATFPQKASISEYAYTYYNVNNSAAKVYNPNGSEKTTLPASGFPMIDENRFFVFLPGGSAFEMLNEDGSLKWEYSGTVPITAFDSSKTSVVAGFADGNICQFDTKGNLLQRFAPGGSEIPVVLGVAVSSDGKYIAAVCGQNKQRFILAKKESQQTKIVAHEFLDSKSTRQMLVKFSKDNSTVFFNSGDKLGIVDIETGKIKHLKISGQAISFQETDDCAFVLTKNEKQYAVYAIEPFATLIGTFSFNADSAFIQTYKNMLFVGKNSTISCIEIN